MGNLYNAKRFRTELVLLAGTHRRAGNDAEAEAVSRVIGMFARYFPDPAAVMVLIDAARRQPDPGPLLRHALGRIKPEYAGKGPMPDSREIPEAASSTGTVLARRTIRGGKPHA